ncbi:MAG TPA: hypothetical protein VK723_05170, partial [Thermoplasmata archaeon]|nr:hypothetical protein [Thermoplasmata archaeon]
APAPQPTAPRAPPPPPVAPPPVWQMPPAPAQWSAPSVPPVQAPPAYAPPAYGPAPAAPFSMAGASPGILNIVGFVFIVLAIIASLVATGLSSDEAFDWAAGIYLLSAILFVIAGLFFFMARRSSAMRPPVQAPYPPR